jgi:phenylalanyl-tRNA synthetase alpha chain
MLDLDDILQQAERDIHSVSDMRLLDQHRVYYLGKKGKLTEYLKTLGQLPSEDRPVYGQKINKIKQIIEELLEKRTRELQKILTESQVKAETLDVTLPGRGMGFGHHHPITKTFDELRKIFGQMGFIFMEGPEIEDDYHNFAALNIPLFHPARAMQDTFYFTDGTLLRTQTSTVQIRAMRDLPLPLRMVAMGRVYRRDFDLTHTPMFHQMECLVINKTASFSELKGLLNEFLHTFFSKDISIRFRPSYFPFTEPSAEVDISCFNCEAKGCRICKNTGWLEVLGCGMVHPNVLKEAGIDYQKYRGFALGAGIDRLTMLKYGITDLRSLFENDLRFLTQF